MLLSRFWYVFLALLLGVATFVLLLATAMYNRVGEKAMAEGLSSDSQVVAWYLQGDARQRAAQLIQFALDSDIQKNLDAATKAEDKVPAKVRDQVGGALRRVNSGIPAEFAFDAVFAVDQHGRVVNFIGYEQAMGMEDFELGGYPVVADALHGFIRDDTLVLDRIYRVVARPVEFELGQMPAGAIVGARIIDDRFARELSQRTNSAVAFYTRGTRVAAGAPETFDKSQMDAIVGDMSSLDSDKDYAEKGRSGVRRLEGNLGVAYAKLPGEAWALGAGYAVGRLAAHADEPLDFFRRADDTDKKRVNVVVVALVSLGAALLGILFSILEHSRVLGIFRREAARLAKGEIDQMFPSKFRGVYRKIASDLNDGIDKVAAKGGVPRRAADLTRVLGDLPAEPQMSAFSLPGEAAPAPPPSAPVQERPLPQAPASGPQLPKPRPQPPSAAADATEGEEPTGQHGRPPPPRRGAPPPPSRAQAPDAKLAEWQRVYQDFVAAKQKCGESIEGFTYEKFEQTLRKNEAALVQRHGAQRVKFSVYVKEGKAALKASPVKD
jgi:hypothetical protein